MRIMCGLVAVWFAGALVGAGPAHAKKRGRVSVPPMPTPEQGWSDWGWLYDRPAEADVVWPDWAWAPWPALPAVPFQVPVEVPPHGVRPQPLSPSATSHGKRWKLHTPEAQRPFTLPMIELSLVHPGGSVEGACEDVEADGSGFGLVEDERTDWIQMRPTGPMLPGREYRCGFWLAGEPSKKVGWPHRLYVSEVDVLMPRYFSVADVKERTLHVVVDPRNTSYMQRWFHDTPLTWKLSDLDPRFGRSLHVLEGGHEGRVVDEGGNTVGTVRTKFDDDPHGAPGFGPCTVGIKSGKVFVEVDLHRAMSLPMSFATDAPQGERLVELTCFSVVDEEEPWTAVFYAVGPVAHDDGENLLVDLWNQPARGRSAKRR